MNWEADSAHWPHREASRFVQSGGLRWHVQHWRREEAITLGGIAEAAAFGRRLGGLVRADAGEEFIQSLDKRGW